MFYSIFLASSTLRLSGCFFSSFFSPGFNFEYKSGITINVPVINTLSPGYAFSTYSFLKTTSIVLGTVPEGKSPLLSYILIFCQSTKTLPSFMNSNLRYAVHFLLVHFFGSVNLNYYSLDPTIESQLVHLKFPIKSSGLTSVVLVIVPLI